MPPQDDMHALAEIMTLLGTEEMVAVASQYGKRFLTSERCRPVDLGGFCGMLAARGDGSRQDDLAGNPKAADLLSQMLKLFYQERITAEQALRHDFFKE